jgi:hypothetical protein
MICIWYFQSVVATAESSSDDTAKGQTDQSSSDDVSTSSSSTSSAVPSDASLIASTNPFSFDSEDDHDISRSVLIQLHVDDGNADDEGDELADENPASNKTCVKLIPVRVHYACTVASLKAMIHTQLIKHAHPSSQHVYLMKDSQENDSDEEIAKKVMNANLDVDDWIAASSSISSSSSSSLKPNPTRFELPNHQSLAAYGFVPSSISTYRLRVSIDCTTLAVSVFKASAASSSSIDPTSLANIGQVKASGPGWVNCSDAQYERSVLTLETQVLT